jgi:hypothetical protein
MSYNHSGMIYVKNGSGVVDESGNHYDSINEAIIKYKLKMFLSS